MYVLDFRDEGGGGEQGYVYRTAVFPRAGARARGEGARGARGGETAVKINDQYNYLYLITAAHPPSSPFSSKLFFPASNLFATSRSLVSIYPTCIRLPNAVGTSQFGTAGPRCSCMCMVTSACMYAYSAWKISIPLWYKAGLTPMWAVAAVGKKNRWTNGPQMHVSFFCFFICSWRYIYILMQRMSIYIPISTLRR